MVDKTQLDSLKKQMRDLREETTVASKKIFNEGASEIFKKYPELEAFSWPQFTPYFCDGDICTFSTCYDYSLSVTIGSETFDTDSDEGNIPEKMGEEIISFLKTFEDDDYLQMFGDHNNVTVNRDGKIETEDYEHE